MLIGFANPPFLNLNVELEIGDLSLKCVCALVVLGDGAE